VTPTLRASVASCLLLGSVLGAVLIEHGFAPPVTVLLLAVLVAVFGVLPIAIAESRARVTARGACDEASDVGRR